MIFTPDIGVVSLQVKTQLKKYFIPEFTSNSHTVGRIMGDVKCGEKDGYAHQKIGSIKFKERNTCYHHIIEHNVKCEIHYYLKQHGPVSGPFNVV
jgi:hypothetical protein